MHQSTCISISLCNQFSELINSIKIYPLNTFYFVLIKLNSYAYNSSFKNCSPFYTWFSIQKKKKWLLR